MGHLESGMIQSLVLTTAWVFIAVLAMILLACIVHIMHCPHCGSRLKYKKGQERSMFFCMSCGYALWDKDLQEKHRER